MRERAAKQALLIGDGQKKALEYAKGFETKNFIRSIRGLCPGASDVLFLSVGGVATCSGAPRR